MWSPDELDRYSGRANQKAIQKDGLFSVNCLLFVVEHVTQILIDGVFVTIFLKCGCNKILDEHDVVWTLRNNKYSKGRRPLRHWLDPTRLVDA